MHGNKRFYERSSNGRKLKEKETIVMYIKIGRFSLRSQCKLWHTLVA